MKSETSTCRKRLAKYCIGDGLDVGFGGDAIIPAAICIDREESSADRAHYRDDPTHLVGDAASLYWFKDGCLDFVYSSHVLEDFEDTTAVLAEWLRVIKPAGHLILFLPDQQVYVDNCNKEGTLPNQAHKHADFSLAYVKECLLKIGITSEDIVHELEFPENNNYSFDLVIRKPDNQPCEDDTVQVSVTFPVIIAPETVHQPDMPMKTLFEKIALEVESNPDGWCSVQKAQTLAAAMLGLRFSIVLEIGVWAGRSLIPMAMALRYLGRGKIIGIDPWNASSSSEGLSEEHSKWWSEVNHDEIFDRFTKRLAASGASDYCEIHRRSSDDYSLSLELDLLHIDGNFSDKSQCHDIERYASKVRIGGLLCMGGTVTSQRAMGALVEMGFQELYKLDTGSMLQRTR